jgi:Zn-dependent protease
MRAIAGKCRVGAGAPVLLAALLLIGGDVIPLAAAAALAHELGHLAAVRLYGGAVRLVRLGITGLSIEYGGVMGYGAEAVIALAGPLVSLALAVAASCSGRAWGVPFMTELAGMSMALCLFNLLPIYPLDGGRAAMAGTARLLGPVAAERVCSVCSVALTAGLVALGVRAVVVSRNVTLLLAAVWLAATRAARSAAN